LVVNLALSCSSDSQEKARQPISFITLITELELASNRARRLKSAKQVVKCTHKYTISRIESLFVRIGSIVPFLVLTTSLFYPSFSELFYSSSLLQFFPLASAILAT